MKVLAEATIKSLDGTIDISILIVKDKAKRPYTFTVKSEWDAREFTRLIYKRLYGKAINYLKANNIRIKEKP